MRLSYVYGHDKEVADFVASLIPDLHGRGLKGASKAFGVINEHGELIAGMVFHNYAPESGVIEMSGAALPGCRWLTAETLRHMYVYPFLQCGCQMVIMRVAADNEPLLRQLAAINYSFILLPRMLGPDRDMVMAQLTYEAWVDNKFCKRYRHHLTPIGEMEEAA